MIDLLWLIVGFLLLVLFPLASLFLYSRYLEWRKAKIYQDTKTIGQLLIATGAIILSYAVYTTLTGTKEFVLYLLLASTLGLVGVIYEVISITSKKGEKERIHMKGITWISSRWPWLEKYIR